jgi:hypothetical protein
MGCFEETEIVPGERHPQESTSGRVSVTKFPSESVDVYDTFPDLRMICMIRDPRDTFCSLQAGHRRWVDEERRSPGTFVRQLEDQRAVLNHPQTVAVRYEELVATPDKIQEVIAGLFDLTIKHPFRDGNSLFFDDEITFALNGIRPPDTGSIGSYQRDKNIGVVKSWLRDNPEISQFIKEMGYEEA